MGMDMAGPGLRFDKKKMEEKWVVWSSRQSGQDNVGVSDEEEEDNASGSWRVACWQVPQQLPKRSGPISFIFIFNFFFQTDLEKALVDTNRKNSGPTDASAQVQAHLK